MKITMEQARAFNAAIRNVDERIAVAVKEAKEEWRGEVAAEWEQELRDLGISVTPDAGAKYDESKRYIEGDVMEFNGESYKSTTYNKGTTPESHPDRWEIVPEDAKLVLVWEDCASGYSFSADDLVTHNKLTWRCTKAHTKSQVRVPLDGSQWWELVKEELKAVKG